MDLCLKLKDYCICQSISRFIVYIKSVFFTTRVYCIIIMPHCFYMPLANHSRVAFIIICQTLKFYPSLPSHPLRPGLCYRNAKAYKKAEEAYYRASEAYHGNHAYPAGVHVPVCASVD